MRTQLGEPYDVQRQQGAVQDQYGKQAVYRRVGDKGDIAEELFAWMRTVYDPVYGVHYAGIGSDDITGKLFNTPNFKRPVTIWQLDQHRNPKNHIILYGCYPKGWKLGEFDYSNGDFHTIEMTLRYDFAVQYSDENSLIPSELNPIAGI